MSYVDWRQFILLGNKYGLRNGRSHGTNIIRLVENNKKNKPCFDLTCIIRCCNI
jgi:hypothetical protein